MKKHQIWKWELGNSLMDISMPKGARIFSVHVQFGTPVIWAIVDPQAEKEIRTIVMVTTGRDFTVENVNYLVPVGTVLLSEGNYVLHVFELLLPAEKELPKQHVLSGRKITEMERRKGRPENFYQLEANEQWDVDKELGILDWNQNDWKEFCRREGIEYPGETP